jgi:hypothetical protein
MSVNQSDESGRGFIADHRTVVYLLVFEIALFGTAILLDVLAGSSDATGNLGNVQVIAGLLAAFAIALGVIILIAIAILAILQRV